MCFSQRDVILMIRCLLQSLLLGEYLRKANQVRRPRRESLAIKGNGYIVRLYLEEWLKLFREKTHCIQLVFRRRLTVYPVFRGEGEGGGSDIDNLSGEVSQWGKPHYTKPGHCNCFASQLLRLILIWFAQMAWLLSVEHFKY